MINYNNSQKLILLKFIWKHLSKKRINQLLILFAVILLSGVAEIYSIASVIPFLNILSGTDPKDSVSIMNPIFEYFSTLKFYDPLIFTTLIFIICISIASFLRLLNLYASNFISAAIGSEFSTKAYSLTLNQPYSNHIKRNSSEIISSIVTQTDVTVGTIKTFLSFFTSVIVSLGLIYSLFLINWILSLSITLILIFLYLLLARYFKYRLRKVSKSRAILVKHQTKAIQEGLGSIRDIILDSSQSFYERIFTRNDKPIRYLAAKSEFIAGAPRYIFEVVSLFLIILIAFFYNIYIDSNSSILPLLGSLALGLQRLLPAFQMGYNAWVNITVSTDSALELLLLLDQPTFEKKFRTKNLGLKDKIILEDIFFSYNGKSPYIVKNFNLEIRKGEKIGIIGPSGSGKSTIADIIMGLIPPTKGTIKIDNINLHKNNKFAKEDWYKNISHVPQDIYLIDSNIAENIAFGSPKEEIDQSKLEKAIKDSKLSNFLKKPSDVFDLRVGERGVKLSGGQKQRIGIARALYKGGQILVLDEATSALDVQTEKSIMETIDNLSSSITVIIITHRLSTLSYCDKTIEIN